MASDIASCPEEIGPRVKGDFHKSFTPHDAISPDLVPDNEAMQPAVLIVEDAETCASILEIILSSITGLRALRASNGDQAWELLESPVEAIRAIVTDLQMPGMDGFELIERVRSDQRHARLPIIVITGITDPKGPERARVLGANAVFTKPYSPARVREKLEQLLDDTQRN